MHISVGLLFVNMYMIQISSASVVINLCEHRVKPFRAYGADLIHTMVRP
jgi:hypothetical protein